MYDEYSKQLIDLLPDLPQIDRAACRRALSSAYFHIVQSRLGVTEEFPDEPLDTNLDLLRSMVDALESVAIFDPLHDQGSTLDVQNASAFVAAEALSLLSTMADNPAQAHNVDILFDESVYSMIEAGLLYMAGGYDANAIALVRSINTSSYSVDHPNRFHASRLREARNVVDSILSLFLGEVRQSQVDRDLLAPVDAEEAPVLYQEILDDVRTRLYAKISGAVRAYLNWLGGYTEDGRSFAVSMLEEVRNATTASEYDGYAAFADIYHLSSLLIAAIDRTSQRSLIHVVPPPMGGSDVAFVEEFQSYLRHRARGIEPRPGRPFLWPSTLEYSDTCLPGPRKNAVVSMPTGSGKSFVAELAVVHALETGWVLYLAPTNALVHQIRRDLEDALEPFSGIAIRSFVGDDEYTTLAGEQIQSSTRRFVAVMTPEKCALATRLYPDQFEDCSLCVFDECHLLNDQHRGMTADILLAQLSLICPNLHFLLMSAMVGNAPELADWLQSFQGETETISIKWRPTRSMRGLLVVDSGPLPDRFGAARGILSQLPPRRVNQEFMTPLGLVVGLTGAWTADGSVDYRACQLPVQFPASASRREDDAQFNSWKNTSSRILSEEFARSGIPTICFLMSSRHHAFSSANKVVNAITPTREPNVQNESFPPLVEAWLSVSDAELGVQTPLRDLLHNGIAVHSSAMLQPEQAASEWMFSHRRAHLMFATGTLAQGINLPAVAVVVAGTSMGDPRDREVDTVAGVTRADAMILNGFGRAGRPGFSNQGIGVLASDRAYLANITSEFDGSPVLRNYDVLGKADAAIDVRSPVDSFLDKLIGQEPASIDSTGDEPILITLLGEYVESVNHAGQILGRTFAAYNARTRFDEHTPSLLNNQLIEIKQSLQEHTGAPGWMNLAAMKAGVDFLRAWQMYSAFRQITTVSIEEYSELDVPDWLQLFFDVMSHMPPRLVATYLPDDSIRRVTVLTKMRDAISQQREVDSIPWQAPAEWNGLWRLLENLVLLYMHGADYSEIAQAYLGIPVTGVNNRRTAGDQPIPTVFKFISEVINRLAMDAGCFLAIIEQAVYDQGKANVPETLQSLPLCIRNGCDSLGTLTWFRYGYRQRSCAHAFQRAFPVPQDLQDDSSRIAWVQQTRREWLAGNQQFPLEPLLDQARIIVTEARSG